MSDIKNALVMGSNSKFIDFDLYKFEAISVDGMFGKLITIFNTTNQDVYFLAKEIAEKLDYFDTRTMYRILDTDEFNSASQANLNKINNLQALIGHELSPRGMTLVNLSGAFHAAFKSTKPEAQQFRKFVTSVILPQIYKTGSYSVNDNSNTKLLEEMSSIMNRQINKLKIDLVEELKVEIEFKEYGIKIPYSCYDIDGYVSSFNYQYDKSITKRDVHTLLRNNYFINAHNTMPTERGLDSGVVGFEVFPIFYKNGTIGKSTKLVVYKKMFKHLNNAMLEHIKLNGVLHINTKIDY